MMETDEEEDDVFGKEEDPAPLCDFGVYVEEVQDTTIVKENHQLHPQITWHKRWTFIGNS